MLVYYAFRQHTYCQIRLSALMFIIKQIWEGKVYVSIIFVLQLALMQTMKSRAAIPIYCLLKALNIVVIRVKN